MELIRADYNNPQHAAAILALLSEYALDPMGGGTPLPENTKQCLIGELALRPFAFSILAYVDGKPVGLANCFEGFSTFACATLFNIHDMVVLPEYRGRGIGLAMLDFIESEARARGACKLTLEVLQGNEAAKRVYSKKGYATYQLDPKMGAAEFLEKKLSD